MTRLLGIACLKDSVVFLLIVSSISLTSGFLPAKKPRIPENVRILVLPGFGNESDDYLLERAPQGSLVLSLLNRGWKYEQIKVLPLQRTDWLKVFLNGLFDINFWLADASPTRPAFAWYLERVAAAVQELTADDEDSRVILLCHSAGGWLARAALGFGGSYSPENPGEDKQDLKAAFNLDLQRVLGMVTLGAPHSPPPPEIMDMTRGALRITDESYPGAYHSPDLFYITVIGNALRGVKQFRQSPLEPTTPTGFAYNSYEAVCGDGTTVGDGVVPVCSGHLDGALQLDLECFHSINAPDNWYGSDAVCDQWHEAMLGEINRLNHPTRATAGGLQIPNPFSGFL